MWPGRCRTAGPVSDRFWGTHVGEIRTGRRRRDRRVRRVRRANFATMTQTNDYSFNAADTAFTANPDITVYDSGTLVYGTPP